MVEALRYKPEGHGFDSRWCHWNISLLYFFRQHCGPGVDSVSNRNEYQEYFLGFKGGRCLGLTTLPPSCADCFEMGAWTSWNPLGLSRPVKELLYLTALENITAYACILKQINVKLHIADFWNTKPSSWVHACQSFAGNLCLHLHEWLLP
jgi:hypothetical protein